MLNLDFSAQHQPRLRLKYESRVLLRNSVIQILVLVKAFLYLPPEGHNKILLQNRHQILKKIKNFVANFTASDLKLRSSCTLSSRFSADLFLFLQLLRTILIIRFTLKIYLNGNATLIPDQ